MNILFGEKDGSDHLQEPFAMPAAVNPPLRSKLIGAADQTVGATQRAGLVPSTSGIARKRLAGALHRAMKATDALHTLLTARDSGTPEASALANELLSNSEFVNSFMELLNRIGVDLDRLKKPAAQTPSAAAVTSDTPKPTDDPVNSDPTAPVVQEKGADSAAMPYTKARLLADITTQNLTAATLARQIGVDAANARVSKTPLVPPWDSPRWTADARSYLQERAASGDGWAAQHIRGDGVPAMDRYFKE